MKERIKVITNLPIITNLYPLDVQKIDSKAFFEYNKQASTWKDFLFSKSILFQDHINILLSHLITPIT